MATLQDATEPHLFDAALRTAKTLIVDFYTPECVFCRKVEPMLAAVADGFSNDLAVVKVDAAANLELAARYGVRGVPNLLLIQGGDVKDRKTGFMTAAMLRDWVRPHLANPSSSAA